MSCQVKLAATLSEVPTVRRHLFPTDDSRGDDSWLLQCHISVCPTGELIALARDKRLVILAAKWDSSSGCNQFEIVFAGVPEENDPISAVLCLPIVGQSQSSHVGPDWTCVVLGFDSGHVRFYTEKCELLLYERLHDETVSGLKCQSQHSPRPDINSELRVEELYAIYPSCICVTGGNVLFTSLRSCRSQLAVVLARNEGFHPLEASLSPRKWGFQEQSVINDVAIVGLDLTTTYDHLLTASTLSGFEARYRAMPPHNSLVLAAGSKPFLAFHYALEGGAQPVLSDVAKAVANKLKSALPGWLTGSKTQPEKQNTTALEPPEPMGCRFGLSDIRRSAVSVVLSPDRCFAATSDSLGRVLVVDRSRGVATRMLKGYRDAQCAFIQVPDEKKSKHKGETRVALFLVVYSGRKGTLEVFSVQKGRKIVTFTAAKFSRLIYVDYGLMGFVGTTKSRYICSYTCVLLDNDGKIKEVVIPFHFALSETNSSHVRDLHLFKRLKQLIKSEEVDCFAVEALNTCRELRTTDVKLQCLDMLVTSKCVTPEVILSCVNHFLEIPDDNDTRNLLVLCRNLQRLLTFYLFITNTVLDKENGNIVNPIVSFSMAPEQTKSLQKLLDLSTSLNNQKAELKVSFNDENDFSISKFLSVFNTSNEQRITLKEDVDEAVLYQVAAYIFKKYIANSPESEPLKQQIVSSKIATEDLFRLLLFYWVNRQLNLNMNIEIEMNNLNLLVLALAQTNPEDISVDYNSTSQFWATLREMLENSSKPFPALTAAIVCHNVSQNMDEIEMQVSDDAEVWERLTQENCQWDLLIGKLEDVSLLNIILGCKLKVVESKLPRLKYAFKDVSLRYILEKGHGSVSELVAKWLTTVGIDPELLVINDTLPEDAEQSKIDIIKNQQIFQHLNLLKDEFPYSLKASVLLCNMSWEYAVAWLKDVEDLGNLEAAYDCLSHIPEATIKQGLSTLLWNTHFKMVFESCCKLINKVGKLPKAKLCQQDTRLTDTQIIEFLEISCKFLDDFMDTAQKCFNLKKATLQYEPIFENGGQPLTELALQQNPVNYDLLHVHYQLSLALLLMATFEVKHSKPITNLFTANVFFCDITKPLNVPHSSDKKILNSQTQFLFKIISASIESITVNEGVIFSMTHVNSMAKCIHLARIWNVEVDLLKRYQIVQLFTSGFDSLAEELLPAVVDRGELGPTLLAIAGKRLAQFLASSAGLAEKMGALSPALTNYLDTLNGEWCSPSSLDAIVNLATLSLRCTDESEQKLNVLLLEACMALMDLESQ